MSSGDASLLPLFLGAGAVAGRKVTSLLGAGARVRLVAPEATPELRRMAGEGLLAWIQRPFEATDVEGAWLIVAATGDIEVQRSVAEAAEAARIFLVAVDDPPNASAYGGAVVSRPPFLVAISSSGATPALTRLVREIIEQVLPGDAWIDHAKALRAKWIADGTPIGERFPSLVRELSERAK
jgi:siroheme synthase-like protein